MTRGLLIAFEGPDGAGKTTVMQQLLPFLEEKWPHQVLSTREPGGIRISERIREIILDVEHTSMDPKTELLLYIAARRQHMVEKILPALAEEKIVLVDRFVDSSVAYQGYGRGLAIDDIDWLNHYVTDNRFPDMTLFFDIDSEVGLQRISKDGQREQNRLDLETLALHQKVRLGYQALAKENPDRFVCIDASKSLDEVVRDSLQVILNRFG